MVKDYPTAKTYFDKCLAVNYYYEDGEVFAKLADIYTNLEQKTEARDILEKGFTMFPQSQSILIGLINYYLTNNEDPNRLFELIALAKKNEPNNASLYYVEGNIYNELRQADPEKADEYIAKAVEAYDACAKINPEYEFGHIGKGVMFYNVAIEIQDKAANEMNQAKYEALVAQMEEALLNALKPFEAAYNMSKDNSLRVNIAEYLKNIYYRFYSKGAEYEAGYNKYNDVVKTGQAK
jgi:tetratricopeptide (TPR) repeat protein